MSGIGQKARHKKTDHQIDDRINAITQSHDILVSTLPISHGSILSSLHDGGVISATFLRAIRIEPLSRDKVKLLLDNVILRDLKNGKTDSFDKLTMVLEGSNNPVAEKLGGSLRERKIDSEPLPQLKIEYNAKTAGDAIHNMHLELIDGIPINLLIPKLRQANVITADDQGYLEKITTDADKTGYLLDEKILKQLQDDKKQLFEGLLHAMKDFDDLICKSLAFQLQVECGMICAPSPDAMICPVKDLDDDDDDDDEGNEYLLPKAPIEGSNLYYAIQPWIYAICRINFEKGGHASGFVGTLTINESTVNMLVTNHHVFQSLHQARTATYEFGYHQEKPDDPSLQPKMITGEELIPEDAKVYINEKISQMPHGSKLGYDALDYFIVEVKEEILQKATFFSKMDGKKYSVDSCKFNLDEHFSLPANTSWNVSKHIISVYHHPDGRVLSKSTQLCRRCDYLLLYLCDTEEGSSGSPIVKTTTDKQRHVIGLHRGDIELNTENYNFGFTMSAIINDIHKKHPKYVTKDSKPDFAQKIKRSFQPKK